MIIEIKNPEIEARIVAQAQAQGLSVEAFIAAVIAGMNSELQADLALSAEGDFIRDMEALAADVPPLPRDFSREDIYFPRD